MVTTATNKLYHEHESIYSVMLPNEIKRKKEGGGDECGGWGWGGPAGCG